MHNFIVLGKTMNRWLSVLGPLLSILVTVENLTELHNVSKDVPMKVNSNHSTINMKTILLNM